MNAGAQITAHAATWPLSLQNKGPRWGVQEFSHPRKQPGSEAQLEKGPETVLHPHPAEVRRSPASVPSPKFCNQVPAHITRPPPPTSPEVLKGILLFNYESFRLSTRSIKAKEQAEVQQVTFAPNWTRRLSIWDVSSLNTQPGHLRDP